MKDVDTCGSFGLTHKNVKCKGIMIETNKNSKRLSLEERKKIEELLHKHVKHKELCKIVGITPSTLYRDIRKCKDFYNAEEAHKNTYQSKNLIDWDIIGKRFGLLTVIEYANKYKRRTWWRCKCDCGSSCVMSRKILSDYCSPDRPLSCGCIAKESKGAAGKVDFEEACLRKFQDLISFRDINGGCWNWTGYKQKGKVPKTSWKNKSMTVRKCMYMLVNGISYEPNRIYVNCGNLQCFNPDHLTLDAPKKRIFYD